MSSVWRACDRFGWLLAIMFVCIGFAICYSQYLAVHNAQEAHFRTGSAERHMVLVLLGELEHEHR